VDYDIRADKTPHGCIIVPYPVIVKASVIQSLPCKELIIGEILYFRLTISADSEGVVLLFS